MVESIGVNYFASVVIHSIFKQPSNGNNVINLRLIFPNILPNQFWSPLPWWCAWVNFLDLNSQQLVNTKIRRSPRPPCRALGSNWAKGAGRRPIRAALVQSLGTHWFSNGASETRPSTEDINTIIFIDYDSWRYQIGHIFDWVRSDHQHQHIWLGCFGRCTLFHWRIIYRHNGEICDWLQAMFTFTHWYKNVATFKTQMNTWFGH